MLILRRCKALTNSIDLPVSDPIFQNANRTFPIPAPFLRPCLPEGLAEVTTLLANSLSYSLPLPATCLVSRYTNGIEYKRLKE